MWYPSFALSPVPYSCLICPHSVESQIFRLTGKQEKQDQRKHCRADPRTPGQLFVGEKNKALVNPRENNKALSKRRIYREKRNLWLSPSKQFLKKENESLQILKARKAEGRLEHILWLPYNQSFFQVPPLLSVESSLVTK